MFDRPRNISSIELHLYYIHNKNLVNILKIFLTYFENLKLYATCNETDL